MSLRSATVVCALLAACGGKPEPVSVGPYDAAVRLEGRFDHAASGPVFELSGSTVWVRFSGTSVKVELGEHSLETDEYGQVAHNWYDLIVDGQQAGVIQAEEGVRTYTIADGLPPGDHLVGVRKRTEAYVGDGELHGFEFNPGAKTLPVPAAARRIEFVGDGITVGFGIDGSGAGCLFSASTENYSQTFAALTAEALGAEQIAVAASGAGVYRNWRGSTENTMVDLYDRALPTRSDSLWDFTRYTPDVVVINLGTSDFTSGDPGQEGFTGSYLKLLGKVRRNYPSATIVVALGPMVSDLWPVGAQALTRSRAYLTQLVRDVNAKGDAKVKLIEFPNQDDAQSFGCKSHPSAATHRQMADQLTAFLRQEMGW
jgi:lysophospholipase L1-like esterase